MKKILTVLMIAMLLTAFAMPQEEQAAPADTSNYAFMKTDLLTAQQGLLENRSTIEKQLANIAWTLRYIDLIETAENDVAKAEAGTEEGE